MTIQEIAERLHDRKLSIVATRTGLHPVTIQRIRDGVVKNPSHETVTILSEYFKEFK